MATEQKNYRSIFKATSLFGGVQVYQILIQIIKSKFVAVLLGPAGVGIMGLYQSGLQLSYDRFPGSASVKPVEKASDVPGTQKRDQEALR